MQIRRSMLVMSILLIGTVLAGCGAAAATQAAVPAPTAGMADSFGTLQEAPAAAAAPTAAAAYQAGTNMVPESVTYGNHMVVKNGDVKLLVKDTDQALDGVTQIVTDMQRYIVSSRVWYEDYFGTNYKHASRTMGVPVNQFENSLRRLRTLAVRVLDENATGNDVTHQ